MEYYRELKKKNKEEKEDEEVCIENLERDILKEKNKIVEIKKNIEIEIDLYQKDIKKIKSSSKLEFNANELDNTIQENNKKIDIYKDIIKETNNSLVIEEIILEKKKTGK